MPLLSVIVPVYNEVKTIRKILEKINQVNVDKEIIVIDDDSCDGTEKILERIQYNYNGLKIIHHTKNRGKGAAFLTGLSHADGEFIIIQDADLEYDPNDYLKLISTIKKNNADIILGARFKKGYHGLFIHRLGNRLLTTILNLLFNSQLNDYATCYKLARKSTFEALNLTATGFDIDVEIICNVLKKNLRILESSVFYYPRSYREGKKIRLKDAIWAIFYMFKYRLRD